MLGSLVSSPVTGAQVGMRYAIVNVAPVAAPEPMPAPTAPAQPMTIFRRRTAQVDPSTLDHRARSFFDVQWVWPPLSAADQTGDPVTDPASLPPPLRAIAYLAQRADGDVSSPVGLPRLIMAAPQPTPNDSPLQPAPAILRFVDAGLPDPRTGYQHRTAGFGLFGQLGPCSDWSDPRDVEHIAAAPSLRLVVGGATQSSFDNSTAGGGAPDDAREPDGMGRGNPRLVASWSGSRPGLPQRSHGAAHRHGSGRSRTVLITDDFAIPAPEIQAYTLSQLVADPGRASRTRSPRRRSPRLGFRPECIADLDRHPGRRDRRHGAVLGTAGPRRSRGRRAAARGGGHDPRSRRLARRDQPRRLPRSARLPRQRGDRAAHPERAAVVCRSGRAPQAARRAWPSRR